MSGIKITLFSAVIIAAMITASPAYAGKTRSASLPATGRTIGGPGSATLASVGLKTIFSIGGGATQDICVTATNGSASTVSITLSTGVGQIFSNETRTFCATAQSDFRASCDAPPCTIQWRVDRM